MVEHIGIGCCDPLIDLVLQLSNPRRVGRTWVASSTVLVSKPYKGWQGTGVRAPKPGDRGTVRVRADGKLIDSLTETEFCDQNKPTGADCGA